MLTISSRYGWDGASGSGWERSIRCSETVPTGYWPDGGGSASRARPAVADCEAAGSPAWRAEAGEHEADTPMAAVQAATATDSLAARDFPLMAPAGRLSPDES